MDKMDKISNDLKIKVTSDYNIAYQNASDLLSSNVHFFNVFPDYFLEVVQSSNPLVYESLKSINFEQQLENADFSAEVTKLIGKYLDDLSEIEKECYKITIAKNLEDPLEFFQSVMSSPMLVNQIKLKIKAEKNNEQKDAAIAASNKTTDQSNEASPEM